MAFILGGFMSFLGYTFTSWEFYVVIAIFVVGYTFAHSIGEARSELETASRGELT